MKSIIILLTIFTVQVKASLISLPENCFEKKIVPCLLKVENNHELVDRVNLIKLNIDKNSIVKFTQFNGKYEMEIIEGRMSFKSGKKQGVEFTLNHIHFNSNLIFAKKEKKKIYVYDVNSFLLSEYDLAGRADQEMVIVKADFPKKDEMIGFISEFFSNKKELLGFLKKIEMSWQKEFKVQIEHQTKVLNRSVASLENAEKERQHKQQLELAELKKVREQFFYRTFYR